jgi:hypothetical protein
MLLTRYATFLILGFAACPLLAAPPPGHPSPGAAMEMLAPRPVPADQLPNSGTVVTSIDANEYTYIEVSTGSATRWIAAPLMAVKPGNSIRYEEGATMTNFYSKLLKRTFSSLMFVGQVEVVAP